MIHKFGYCFACFIFISLSLKLIDMKYLGMIRFQDQDFKHQNDSLKDAIDFLHHQVEDNPGSVIVGILNTETFNIEFVGDAFKGKEEYVKSELTDLAKSL